ncbi:hypothetical protein MAPG_04877 [Magnaporthiopsis poae ATCC 64411]|uniref:Uncharacterized protein n=1 Tax=Magnaporthiopsis poae (strain ATCC 64411 / 73-15) TaxID=644358 RepID=A0A0C4DXX0_MAGP6|nr:hypothetical protein MAPG_04877 [Magnaporthiopsis poae ATCC 64411]
MSIHQKVVAVLEAVRGGSGAVAVEGLLQGLATDAQQWESASLDHVRSNERATEAETKAREEQKRAIEARAAADERTKVLEEERVRLSDLVVQMRQLRVDVQSDMAEQKDQVRDARAAANAEKAALQAQREALAAEKDRWDECQRQLSQLVGQLQSLNQGMEAERTAAAKDRQKTLGTAKKQWEDVRKQAEVDMQNRDAVHKADQEALKKERDAVATKSGALGEKDNFLESCRVGLETKEAEVVEREAKVTRRETQVMGREAWAETRWDQIKKEQAQLESDREDCRQTAAWLDQRQANLDRWDTELEEREFRLHQKEADLREEQEQVRLREAELDQEAAAAQEKYLARESDCAARETECVAREAECQAMEEAWGSIGQQRQTNNLLNGGFHRLEGSMEAKLARLSRGLDDKFDYLEDIVNNAVTSTEVEMQQLAGSAREATVVLDEVNALVAKVTRFVAGFEGQLTGAAQAASAAMERGVGGALDKVVVAAESRLAALTPPSPTVVPGERDTAKRTLSSPERHTPGSKRGRVGDEQSLQKREDFQNILVSVACCLHRVAAAYDGNSDAKPDDLCQRLLSLFSEWPTCAQQLTGFLQAEGLEKKRFCVTGLCFLRWEQLQEKICYCHKLEGQNLCMGITRGPGGTASLFWQTTGAVEEDVN